MTRGKEARIDSGLFFEILDDAETIERVAARYLDPNMDWDSWTTYDLLALLRSNVGREIPAVHAKLKEILATRPHIPTKAEAKKKRQEAAKARNNR